MNKNLYKVITLGAVWGIFEATAGYMLHLLGIRIGSMIWFPIAYFFVHTAYRYTDSFYSAMLTAFIASSLKMINLFFPGRIDMVINPAVSIIIEASAVILVYKYVINRRLDKINPLTVMLTGFIWRSLYICYIFSMPRAYFDISSFTAADTFIEFMFVKNMINILIISAGFFAARVIKAKFGTFLVRMSQASTLGNAFKPAVAVSSMILAIAAQVFIR